MEEAMAKLTEALDKSVKTIVDKEGKYLTFSLGGAEWPKLKRV
jgi:hypothetical protein